jgi:hypothetical protein
VKRAWLLAVLVVAGCESAPSKEPPPEPTPEQRMAGIRDKMSDRPDDLSLRYALAREQEQKGLLEAAALNYGIVANELPPKRYTRAMLAFGRVELALGRDVSARRALEDVLAVPSENETSFTTNPDYREAAVRLAPLLLAAERWAEIEALHKRFVDELGGDEEEWPIRY